MTSREAFEAEYGTIQESSSPMSYNFCWQVWQRAIQHARDVAAEIVLRELDSSGQARAINDAIKEALK